jgi:RNA polymerase sigma factor (sigma-70 family)
MPAQRTAIGHRLTLEILRLGTGREKDLQSLLSRCQKSDQHAWSELVEHFQSLVYSIPKRMGLSDDDSSDVFQNTFLALHRSLDRIENAQTLPKWLSVTASREALRQQRFKAKGGQQESEERTLDEIVADEESSAEDMAVSSVEASLVRQGLAKLADKCRQLLELLFVQDDVSYQEISETLGIPMGAIGPTRARCLEKLRKSLEGTGLFG